MLFYLQTLAAQLMTIYLDCNASSPLQPEVLLLVMEWLQRPGNSSSRTHQFGVDAQRAVARARDQVAAVVGVDRSEVIFTSGATEANNLAILGLKGEGDSTGRRHIVTSSIEHKAVLEPIAYLESNGYSVSYVRPDASGVVSAASVLEQVRPDTLLVSLMHVNNETGVIQPIEELADALESHPCFLHTDAAQGFGKRLDGLRHSRIDLMSVSGHKIYAPQGVGALIARRRQWKRIPLKPLMLGGGQEGGLRPGTLPTAMIAGLGLAAELAVKDEETRWARNASEKQSAMDALSSLEAIYPSGGAPTLPSVLSVRIPGLDSEAAMLALRDLVAFSNGSACNSQRYEVSHVLSAMGFKEPEIDQVVRLSWSHLTPSVDWSRVVQTLRPFVSAGRVG